MATRITLTGDGTPPVVNLTFPYIDRAHVKATVDDVAATFTWTGASQITFDAAAAAGSEVVVYRDTPADPPLVDYNDIAVLTADDLDLADKQLRYHQEELDDRLITAEDAVDAKDAAEAAQTAAEAAQTAAETAETNASSHASAASASATAADNSATEAASSLTALRGINVKSYGAVGDGVTDDSAAIQAAVDAALSAGSRVVYFPLQNGEVYNLGASTITISSSGFMLLGDAAPSYYPENGGYITGTATDLFDYGGGSGGFASNQLTVDGLAFYTTGKTQNAIKFTQDNNGPHRGVIIRNTSAKGFDNVLKFDIPTGSSLAAASAVFENNVFYLNNNAANAVERVVGLRYVGNQSEQGARITGDFNTGVTIHDNMLEGQSNPVNIDSAAPSVDLMNNYFEAVSGDYHVRVRGTNNNAVLTVDHNYISNPLSTDIYRVENVVRLHEDRAATITSGRKANITLKSAFIAPGSRALGKFYLDPHAASASRGFLSPFGLTASMPSTAVTKIDLGSVSLDTPWGKHATGYSTSGFPADYHSMTKSWSVGDVIVAVALVKVEGGGQPYFGIYNESYSQPGITASGQTVPDASDGEWQLLFSMGKATVAGTTARFRFGSDGTGAGVTTLRVAAVGIDVIPAANFVQFNATDRAFVRLFNPLGHGPRTIQTAAPTDISVSATTGSLPTPNGSVTIADAAAPTNAELLKYSRELEAKLHELIDKLQTTKLWT